jgi:hypothetical protein
MGKSAQVIQNPGSTGTIDWPIRYTIAAAPVSRRTPGCGHCTGIHSTKPATTHAASMAKAP